MKRIFPYLVLSLFILTNCGQSKKQDKISESEEQTSETSETSGEREPTDEEIREYGILTSIEDAPYPMFSIDMEFPEREMKMSFLFNVEESPLDMTELLEMKGKYATIYYTSDGEPDIYDIHRECESLLGEDAIDINEADQEITGIVSGAESQTTGDLPDELTITSRDGTKLTFQCFITEEMAAANGDEVTVFYRVHYRNTITHLKASEDD